MQTKHLASFLSAVAAKSLSKAAAKLNYAPSTIYEHVAALEKELAAELYNHSAKEFELTAEGRILADYSENILTLWEKCRSEISGKYQEQIRICASETLSKYYIYKLLSEFAKKRPLAKIDFTLVPAAIAVERIRGGDCDVAFSFGVSPPLRDVAADKLFSQKMIFAAHPAHSFVRCKSEPKTIQREVLISNLDVDYVKKIINEAGIDFDLFFSSYIRVGGVDLAKNFPLNNDGVTLLPEIALSEELMSGRLSAIEWLGQGVAEEAYVLTSAKRARSAQIEELVAMASKYFEE